MPTNSHDHRDDVQGLRAIAVLLVVAAHAGFGRLAGGYVGVDVFFVVSGFLITSLLMREVAARGRVSITGFYARRARRILPAATVVVLVVMAYAARWLAPVRVAEVGEDARWSALFAANVHFGGVGEDYFDSERTTSPFQHFWSLAVEEQFYLVWPLLLGALVLVGVRGARHLAALLAVACVASVAWWVHLCMSDPQQAHFSSVARAWELALGALLAVLAPRLARLGSAVRTGLGATGLAALVVAAVSLAGSTDPGTWWRIPAAVLGTAALLAAGTGGVARGTGRLLASRPLTWLGDRSYSLYLWHWPVLVLGPIHVAGLDRTTGTLALLAVTAALTAVSYHLVEQPFRRGRVVGRDARALVLWPAALVTVLVTTFAAAAHAESVLGARLGADAPRPAPLVSDDAQVAVEPRSLPEPRSVVDLLRGALAETDRGGPVPFPMSNLPDLAADSWHLAYPCNSPPAVERSKICPIGDLEGGTTVAVYGDSRAGQWLPALDRLGRAEELRIVPHIKYGCPPYPVRMLDGGGAQFHTCHAWRGWSRQQIRDLDPDVVLLSAEVMSWRVQEDSGLDHAQTWARGVGDLVDSLRRDGALVVVLGDIPVFDIDPEGCLTTPGAGLGDCDLVSTGWPAEPNAFTATVARQHGAAYVDAARLSCLSGRCPLVVSGTVTYSDESHLSASWTRTLAGPLGLRLREALASLTRRTGRGDDDRAGAGVWP